MKFKKPPLVELLAEFRWIPVDSQGQEAPIPFMMGVLGPEAEAFYDRVRAALAIEGYNSVERMIPQGLPVPPYQPIFRYRSTDENRASTIFQLGIGVFSVHALPPYENWDSFKPVIEKGLKALLGSRITRHSEHFFSRVSLRYIDAFGPELTEGRSVRRFTEDVLRLRLNLPDPLAEEIEDSDAVDLTLQLNSKLKAGLELGLNVGANPAMPGKVFMDIVVSSSQRTVWNQTAPIEILESAHKSVRHMFFDMTKPIHNLMELTD